PRRTRLSAQAVTTAVPTAARTVTAPLGAFPDMGTRTDPVSSDPPPLGKYGRHRGGGGAGTYPDSRAGRLTGSLGKRQSGRHQQAQLGNNTSRELLDRQGARP